MHPEQECRPRFHIENGRVGRENRQKRIQFLLNTQKQRQHQSLICSQTGPAHHSRSDGIPGLLLVLKKKPIPRPPLQQVCPAWRLRQRRRQKLQRSLYARHKIVHPDRPPRDTPLPTGAALTSRKQAKLANNATTNNQGNFTTNEPSILNAQSANGATEQQRAGGRCAAAGQL